MIKDLLQNKTAKEKSNIKATEVVKLDLQGEYIKGDYRIEITSPITKIEDELSKFLRNANENDKIKIADTDIEITVAELKETIPLYNDIFYSGIEFYAKAWKNGKPLGLGDGTIEIERFIIINPPILVDDSNGNIIREWTDNITGELKTRKLREDPAEAIRQTLAHTIKVSGREDTNIIKGSVGNTTSTFFPAAGANSPVDGEVVVTNSMWSTAHDATTGSPNDTSEASQPGTALFSGGNYTIRRGMYLFNTASINTDTIDSATFSIHGNGDSPFDADTTGMTIVSSSPASDDGLVNADYDQIGSTSFGSLLYSGWSASGYNDVTLNSSGESNVNKTGISKFAMLGTLDFSNTAPLGFSTVSSYFADRTGTADDPKLVVIHSAAATIGAKNLMTMGVGK